MNNFSAAVRHLRRSDPVLRRVIDRIGKCELRREHVKDPFGALADAIIYQQLAYKAAQTIANRFRQLYGSAASDGRGRLPSPRELLATPRRKLRSVGLSRQKSRYLLDLARHAASGALPLNGLAKMDDAEIIERVTAVKGIGRWTADMFLIFCLGRPDVLPVNDLGLQYGFRRAYKMRRPPSAARMEKIAEAWRPYRTAGSWYMWMVRREEVAKKSQR